MGVAHGTVIGKGTFAQNHGSGSQVRQLFQVIRGKFILQADQQQIILAHRVECVSIQLLPGNFLRQRNSKLQHDFRDHILIGTVRLDPVDHVIQTLGQGQQIVLSQRGSIPQFQVGRIQFEDFETGIARKKRICILDFLSGTTDTFFSDFTDILISGFEGFTVFRTNFRQLNHNKMTISAILNILLHHSMCKSS